MPSAPTDQTIVLITGANAGIGLAIVENLAANHPNFTILLGSRNHDNGTKAASAITPSAKNTTVAPIQLDVTSDDSISKAVEFVTNEYGRLDVLYNNAGVSTLASFDAKDQRGIWNEILNINATSAYLVAEAFVPLLRKSSFPRIAFMSSGLGSVHDAVVPNTPFFGMFTGPYATSKAAMNMIAAQLGAKYKDEFRINVTCPGFIKTKLNGYNENAQSDTLQGTIEAVRIITQSKDGKQLTFTNKEGAIPW
jgi:NAD(P)-dependent dehydrogenase (short-subunit alcohol dehydrogenase family)